MPDSATYHLDERNLDRQRLLAAVLNPLTEPFLTPDLFPPNAQCLDIGCGLGETTRLIAACLPSGGQCVGIERDPALVAAAHGDPAIVIGEGDATDLPFPDDSFDFVFARYLMMHLPDPLVAIREMVRVARPGGAIMLFEPDFYMQRCYPASWGYAQLPSYLEKLLPDPFIGLRLTNLLRDAGADDVVIRPAPAIEQGDNSIRRVWRMTIESMGPGFLAKGILSQAELDSLIQEFVRVENDPNTSCFFFANLCAWGRVPVH